MARNEVDRDRVGKAVYEAWCEINTTLGPWRALADWKKENFRRLADAAVDAWNECSEVYPCETEQQFAETPKQALISRVLGVA